MEEGAESPKRVPEIASTSKLECLEFHNMQLEQALACLVQQS